MKDKADYPCCSLCDQYVNKLFAYKEQKVCLECSIEKKYIRVSGKLYKKYDLKHNVLVATEVVNVCKKIQNEKCMFTYITHFHPKMKNIEWYKYCFGKHNNVQNNLIKFDRSNKNHMWLFKQCTRFNHNSNYVGFGENCFQYNSNETSVEQVLNNIITLRMVMLRHLVPRCLRDYIVNFYLKF